MNLHEILKHYVWYSWEYGHLSTAITTSCPANQSDAKLLEGGVDQININHMNYHKTINPTINIMFVFIQITINWMSLLPLALQIVPGAISLKRYPLW